MIDSTITIMEMAEGIGAFVGLVLAGLYFLGRHIQKKNENDKK